jgi:hypothetical protein
VYGDISVLVDSLMAGSATEKEKFSLNIVARMMNGRGRSE